MLIGTWSDHPGKSCYHKGGMGRRGAVYREVLGSIMLRWPFGQGISILPFS
jgi:hypothetical protein